MKMKNLLFSSFFILIFFCGSSDAQQACSSYSFSDSRSFATCSSLPVLNAFLHWTYHQSNNTVDLAYRHTGMTSSNWVVWALNPTRQGMLGSQCLVALTNSSGLVAYTSPIADSSSGYGTQLQSGPLSFRVPRISAELVGDQMIIFATIELPSGGASFSQVWQHGSVSSGTPQIHDTRDANHLASFGTIDFSTGTTVDTGGSSGGSRERKRNIHGVLNVVSWGILMPIGAIMARYVRVYKPNSPAWFYLHVTCQASAYIIGVAGWGTGLKLGSDSPGVERTKHRNIGIALFVMGTLQVFALLLRPKPDHKYRVYWNMYHIGIGYSVISLSIVNILEGFDILEPEKKWKRAYIGILISLGVTFVVLEPIKWIVAYKRKNGSNSDKYPNVPGSGLNGINGHGA